MFDFLRECVVHFLLRDGTDEAGMGYFILAIPAALTWLLVVADSVFCTPESVLDAVSGFLFAFFLWPVYLLLLVGAFVIVVLCRLVMLCAREGKVLV